MTTNKQTHQITARTWHALGRAVSTDETRFNLQAIFVDAASSQAVATDGHRLHAVVTELDAGFYLAPQKAPKKADRGKAPALARVSDDRQFPGWRKVIPSSGTARQIGRWTEEMVKRIDRSDVIVVLGPDGPWATIRGLKPDHGKDAPAVNGAYLADAIRFVGDPCDRDDRRKKVDPFYDLADVGLAVGDPMEPVMLTSSDGRMAVIMPMRI